MPRCFDAQIPKCFDVRCPDAQMPDLASCYITLIVTYVNKDNWATFDNNDAFKTLENN